MLTTFRPLEFKEQRVMTTSQLAVQYGTKAEKIKQNFNNNKNKYLDGKHYYLLEGTELKAFKNEVENFDLVGKNASNLYLWTEKGALLHAKSLGTVRAWEVYDELVETYFKVQAIKTKLDNLSPQLQFLITMELKQKELESKIEKVDTRLDNITEIVALNSTKWRKDTNSLINKMANSCGGYEHITDIRNEGYTLLEQRYGVQLKTRLTNKRKTLALNGAYKSKIDSINNLDVIADDKKLIEGFTSIVKEMSIKYRVNL